MEKQLSSVLGIASISNAGQLQDAESFEASLSADRDHPETDLAALHIQEVRAKHERANKTDLRRIETYFEKLLSLKVQHDTLEQESQKKESKLIKNYEERKYSSAVSRLDQQVVHS
eukprot:768637-Hanusia_phi.AAC.8